MRVLIADDRYRSRQGLRALLGTQPEIEVVGEARDGQEALQLIEERRPQAVLMDAKMPVMNGLAAAHVIKERWPKVRVIILTMYDSLRDAALDVGVDVFLVKGCSIDELLRAITALREADDAF